MKPCSARCTSSLRFAGVRDSRRPPHARSSSILRISWRWQGVPGACWGMSRRAIRTRKCEPSACCEVLKGPRSHLALPYCARPALNTAALGLSRARLLLSKFLELEWSDLNRRNDEENFTVSGCACDRVLGCRMQPDRQRRHDEGEGEVCPGRSRQGT